MYINVRETPSELESTRRPFEFDFHMTFEKRFLRQSKYTARSKQDDIEVTTKVLMDELAQIREDDRSALIQISTIMGVALALLVVITELAIYFRHTLPWSVYLCVPVLPGVLITYVLLLGTNASIRTYYARSLEYRLTKRIQQDETRALEFPTRSHFESHLNGTNAVA